MQAACACLMRAEQGDEGQHQRWCVILQVLLLGQFTFLLARRIVCHHSTLKECRTCTDLRCLSRMFCRVLSRSRASCCSRMTSAYVRTEASGVWSPIAKASLRVGEMILCSLRFLQVYAHTVRAACCLPEHA
jgi:hypothetical protein